MVIKEVRFLPIHLNYCKFKSLYTYVSGSVFQKRRVRMAARACNSVFQEVGREWAGLIIVMWGLRWWVDSEGLSFRVVAASPVKSLHYTYYNVIRLKL